MKSAAYIPTLLWLAAITWLSLSGGVRMPKFNLLSTDKLAHAAAYLLLAALCVWGYRRSTSQLPTSTLLWLIFVGCTLYGAFMEWVQGTYFPNRTFEYDDMIANAVGALLGTLLSKRL
jgi:VanZ family protein